MWSGGNAILFKKLIFKHTRWISISKSLLRENISKLSLVKYQLWPLQSPVKPEAVVQRYLLKEVLLKITQNSQENTCARVSFIMKFQAETWNFIKKEFLAQVFSCKFSKRFKNTFFKITPSVAASPKYEHSTKSQLTIMEHWKFKS